MAEEKSVIVIGTLTSFLPGFEWYYNVCKRCNKKVTTDDPKTYELDRSECVEHKKTIKCPTNECNKNNITISTVPRQGLCNGNRLKILSLASRVIEAEVISGSNIGNRTFIPRISLTPSDKKIPFKFKRRQFPISVCFAMTINKSQGQSLSRIGLYLRQPVFLHGQLYVALSRVKSRDGFKLVTVDKDGILTNKTVNVVCKEVFRDL